MTTVDEDVEDAQVNLPSPAVHHAPAVAATTCRVQWRRDARVLGPPPLRTGVFGAPPLGAIPTLFREYLFVAVWASVSLGCQPGSYESAPFFAWSVLGSPPFSTVHHCTGQVATDPQSPKGGSQRACPQGVPTPRLLGVSQRWRCLSSRTLLWQLRPLSLRVASLGVRVVPFV